MEAESSSIKVNGMQFGYSGENSIFVDFNLKISPRSRCLLVGANGSGKTTLLKILAGKHMVGGRNVVRVLDFSSFHDTHLVCSGDLSYLGGSWTKTVGSAGEVPLQGDFSAEHMIFGVEGIDPVRREKLIDLLDIDLQWRMHKVSDGQRRRVQICLGLLHPFQEFHRIISEHFRPIKTELTQTEFHQVESDDCRIQTVLPPPVRGKRDCFHKEPRLKDSEDSSYRLFILKVLLLDEVTVDLDVVARMDLLEFFKEECEQRGATIVYATHIFDGLESWATDLAYIQDGELKRYEKLAELPEMKNSANLLSVVESWLRSETKNPKKKPVDPQPLLPKTSPFDSSPFRSSRHMAYYR